VVGTAPSVQRLYRREKDVMGFAGRMGQYYSSLQAAYAESIAQGDVVDLATPQKSPRATSTAETSPAKTPAKSPEKPATPKPQIHKASTPKAKTPKKSATPLKIDEIDEGKREDAPLTPKRSTTPAKEATTPRGALMHVSVPSDLVSCKLAELRDLAEENNLKKTGAKYELIGRLLAILPPEKLTEESLGDLKLADLKSMAKGAELPQVGTKAQLISQLIAYGAAPERAQAAAVSAAAAPKTRQVSHTPHPKRRRADIEAEEAALLAPLTERKAKRSRMSTAVALKIKKDD